MKTSFIPLFIALSIPACVDHSIMTGAGDSANSPAIVITQPATKDNITAVVDTLRDSFTRMAQATSGAQVPNPHLSILMRDGKTLEVPAPKSGDALFGENSPMARQHRLEGQLKALSDKLNAGCSGNPVSSKVIKDVSVSAFKGGTFQVWAASGGANPWTPKEHSPTAFIEDRNSFAHVLMNSDKQSGRYLILTDSTRATEPKPKPAKPIAGPAKANPSKVAPKLKSKTVATETKEKPTPSASAVPPSADKPAAGSQVNISVNSYPAVRTESKEDASKDAPQSKETTERVSHRLVAVKLPDNVEPIGEPILFAPGSTKLTREGLDAIAKAATMLKASHKALPYSLFLAGRADASKDEAYNNTLSQKRADAVRVALLDHGITVQQTFAIGESLSREDATTTERALQRSVQMYGQRTTDTTTKSTPSKPLVQSSK